MSFALCHSCLFQVKFGFVRVVSSLGAIRVIKVIGRRNGVIIAQGPVAFENQVQQCLTIDRIFHSFAATVEDTVLFEVKQGPYQKISDKDFASWAPVEGSAEARDYLKGLYDHG